MTTRVGPKKRVVILGSTGSIGTSALEVIRRHADRFQVVGLVAGTNSDLLKKQCSQFKPRSVYIKGEDAARKLKKTLGGKVFVASQAHGLGRFCQRVEADILIAATSGIEALEPVIHFLKQGKKVALANKEVLVAAGGLVMDAAASNPNARLVPVDSEHSAIFQCLEGHSIGQLKKIFLTGSGGPLRRVARGKFDQLTKEAVINHPKWRMGKKISVDSATMMNKGLELIEASWLFRFPVSSIEILIHPEAIVHSMIEFTDGCILAQLGVTDMKLPIQYALSYPDRLESWDGMRLSLGQMRCLRFFQPARRKFPCLDLAYEAAKKGGFYPCVLSAVDEIAVRAYLADKIRFKDIPRVIEKVMQQHRDSGCLSVERVRQVHEWAAQQARMLCRV